MTGGGEPIRIAIAYGAFDEDTLAAFRAVSPRLVFDVTERYGQAGADEAVTPETDGLIGHSLPSDPSRAPHAGGVDNPEVAAVPQQRRVDRVARRPRHVADQHALGAQQPVDQRRLSYVGPADDRKARLLIGQHRARG